MIKDLDELEKLDHAQKIMNEFDHVISYQFMWAIYSKLSHKLDRLHLIKILNMLVTTKGTLKSSMGRVLVVEWTSTSKRMST